MYSDACCNFQCQEPLVLRNTHTGEEVELLCWDWLAGSNEQVATLKGGARVAGSILAQHWVVKPCHCGEAYPAENWPLTGPLAAVRKASPALRKTV